MDIQYTYICKHYINTFNLAKVYRRLFESIIMQAFIEKIFETGLLLQQKKLFTEHVHHSELFLARYSALGTPSILLGEQVWWVSSSHLLLTSHHLGTGHILYHEDNIRIMLYLQSFILRHGPGLVHCEPPLFSNLNWGISQWAQKYRISQWAQQYRIS